MKAGNTPKRDYSHGPSLEPRVAKLELGMERLTDDVRDLAQVVRTQGSTMEQEIQKLVVAVTQAQGPKKTDWGVIIAAAGLVLAIGGAAFWPLNQQVQELKAQQATYYTSMVEHQKLDNHPVGAALVKRLEEQFQLHTTQNAKDLSEHIAMDAKEIRLHYHEELEFQQKLQDAKNQLVESEMKGLREKLELYTDKLYARVVSLENTRLNEADKDKQELLLWRQKAMGLSTPPSVVVPRDQVYPKK